MNESVGKCQKKTDMLIEFSEGKTISYQNVSVHTGKQKINTLNTYINVLINCSISINKNSLL